MTASWPPQLEAARAEHESEKKALDDLLRDRDIQNKQLVLAFGTNQKQADQVKVHENTRRNLEQEIAGYRAEAHKQRKMIFLLEKDGDKYGAEAADASTKWAQALEEVKVCRRTPSHAVACGRTPLHAVARGRTRSHAVARRCTPLHTRDVTSHTAAWRPATCNCAVVRHAHVHACDATRNRRRQVREMSIIQLQKRIVEGDTKLKQQQSLYEAVRSDRNLYSKNLIESQEEIAEMKRKFRIMHHQIEQLKEEIHTKDQV